MLRSTLKIFFLLASFSFLAACGGGDDGPDCTDTAAQNRGMTVIASTCQNCHASSVTGAARMNAPVTVTFDDAGDIDMHDDRIRVRAVEMKTMPPAGALPAGQISDLEAFLDCR
jgi:uncharacterized membrane protein